MSRKDKALQAELIDVNWDLMCVHTSEGTFFCATREEMMEFIIPAQTRIKMRPHPLSRWEHWEIPDGDAKHEHKLLLVRARNDSEKALIRRYIEVSKEVGVKVDRGIYAQ